MPNLRYGEYLIWGVEKDCGYPPFDYHSINVAEAKRDVLEEVINYLGLALEAMEKTTFLNRPTGRRSAGLRSGTRGR
jgi:hypothetical protein